MKIKHILAFSLVAISSAFFLNSCGDGGETNPAPGIDFIAENGSVTSDVTMDGDKAFTMIFQVTDNSKVSKVEVKSVVNGRVSPQLDTTINSANAKITLKRKSYAAIATEVWTITATDDKGVSSSKSITISTTSAATGDPLTSFEKDNDNVPFKLWNFQGPKPGAFNLLDGVPMTKNDPNAEKDLQDSCESQEVSTWPARVNSKNGTIFKKVTGYAYSDIKNTGQLDAVWDASGAEKKFFLAVKGDLYIAKISRTGAKVLISITEVVKTSSDNLDYTQFSFKKKTL